MKNFKINIDFWDIFIALNLLALFGGIVYKVYKLDVIGIFLATVLSIGSFLFLDYLKPKVKNKKHHLKTKFESFLKKKKQKDYLRSSLYLLYSILYLFLFYILSKNSTQAPITSPWEVVPFYFFGFYFLATFVLFLILRKSQEKISLFFISLHFFLSFSVALIVYKIGYGFDPFVHQATLDIIAEKGFVDPKTFYYLGFYGLIIIINKIFFIPIVFLNKFLVPILASIFLPRAIFDYLETKFEDKKTSFLTITILLIFPFSFLIMSTPQNFAYLLALIVIIKSLNIKNYHDLAFVFLLSLVATITQPLAGIPVLLFSGIVTIFHSELRIKKILFSLFFISLVFILPVLFYVFENKTGQKIVLENNILSSLGASVSNSADGSLFPFNPQKENIILNTIYLYGFNIKFLILLLSLSGIYIYKKNKKECPICPYFLLSFLSLFISYLLTSSLSFSFLVDYERNNYSDRILLMSVFFLLPFFILSLYGFLYKLKEKNLPIKIPIYIFFLILVASSLYFSYPRLDRYHNSHGISTGIYDIEATTWIEKNNEHQYAVLANQQVSAAALKNFGFNKYFSNNIFYYPIPTSSPLYQNYLNMVYDKPSKENALEAMNLLNIDEVYFVLNKYWWAFPKILEEAKLEADSYTSFGEGDVYVFKYSR